MSIKQYIAALIAVLMFFPLFGCGAATPPDTSQTSSSEQNSTPPVTTQTPQTTQTTFPIIIQTTTTSQTSVSTEPSETTSTTNAPPITTTTMSSQGNGVKLEVPPPGTDLLGLTDAQVSAFFDDAVFVGDSVSLGWRNYVTKKRNTDPGFMGGAKFLVSGSLGAGNSLWDVKSDSVHPTFQGEQMQLWKSIPLTGAKKLFIMLGLNDVGAYSIENSVNNYKKLLNNIKTAVPDIQIYILSATYMYKGSERGKLTSERLRELNVEIIKLCHDNGYDFINIADPLATPEGNLKPEYCSDKYVHQTEAAYIIWTRLLKGVAASKLKA